MNVLQKAKTESQTLDHTYWVKTNRLRLRLRLIIARAKLQKWKKKKKDEYVSYVR